MIKQTNEESKQETVAPIGISSELADSLEACANKLTAERKATKPPTGYPSKKDLSKFTVISSVKGSSPVNGIDSAEDVIILVSREDSDLTGLDFEGRNIFNLDIRGIAKFWNGTDKIFISGKESGLYDL